MSSPTVTSSSARRRTFGGGTDPALSEWSSRIRQLQQDVDDDVEQEQKRLADEIAASRLERTRRRGTGTYVLSPEIAQDLSSDGDDMRAIVDRQQHQSDAFRKLVAGSASGDASSTASRSPPPSDTGSSRTAPISLAQFMGGRATGPRLNKPAPQPEAADYTSYQRPQSSHPVFGARALSPTSSDGFSVSQRARQRSEPAAVALPGLSNPRSTTPSSRAFTPEPPRSTTPHTSDSLSRARSPETPARVASPPVSRTPEPVHSFARSSTPTSRRFMEIPPKSHTPEPAARAISPPVSRTPERSHTPTSRRFSEFPPPKSHTPEPAARAISPQASRTPEPGRSGTPGGQRAASPYKTKAHDAPRSSSPRGKSPVSQHFTGPKSRPTTPHSSASRAKSKSPPPARPFTPKSPTAPAYITATSTGNNQFRSSATSRPLPTPSASTTPSRSAGSAPSINVTTPLRTPASASTTPKSSPQPAATPSFLARPLPPRNPPAKQIIPSTTAVSQAFLKPPKEKDLTPSLSRLQGRGFVEQRVKAARQLNDAVFLPKSPPAVGELGERRKSSLVDMWVRKEEEVASPTSPQAPATPPPPKLVGKLATPFAKAQALVQAQSPVATPSKPAPPPAAAKPVQVLPVKSTPPPVAAKPVGLEPSAPKTPNPAAVPEQPLGSTHTTISFVKAEPGAAEREIVEKVFVRPKTPNGIAHAPRPVSRGAQDETKASASKPSASALERQPSDSTPLTHLTKGRPKKRKGGSSAPTSSAPAPAPAAEVPQLVVPAAESSASDFDSVRVRSELIKQFPSPPGMDMMDEHGRMQAFREAPPEGEVLPGGATTAATQQSDGASGASPSPSVSIYAAGVEAWADRAPIGVAPVLKKTSADGVPMVVGPGRGRALPGLAAMGGASPFSSGGSSGVSGAEDGATERPVGKHPRIPSTGARATVMDVAQALQEQHARESSATSEPDAPEPEAAPPSQEAQAVQEPEEEEAPRIGVRAAAAMWEKQSLTSSDSETERRPAPVPLPTNGRGVSPHLPPLPKSPPPPVPEPVEAPPLAFSPSPVAFSPPPVAFSPPPVAFSPPPEAQPHTVPIPRARPPAMAERRRSTYEKYSSIILPPLKEEVTPVNSPQASLSRAYTNGTSPVPAEVEPQLEEQTTVVQEVINQLTSAPVEALAEDVTVTVEPDVHEEHHAHDKPERHEPALEEQEQALEEQPQALEEEEPVIELEHDDGLLPPFNLNSIHAPAASYTPDESVQTLSVEVFIISGSTSTPARKPQHVFYETETVAVVYRAKDQKSGLVNSKVWAWRGRDANAGEREEQKLTDLAKRFGTTLIECPQGSEPFELVHILGGVLVTRQGPRAHWSADNTAMHRVRFIGNVMFIDQQDLDISNLCSGSSFCLSLLGSFYVWHGRGSLEVERQEALSYAKKMLATEGTEVIELNEGAEDEMFWAMLGDAPYANAEYWQWRIDLPHAGPRLFRIDSGKGKDAVKHISHFSAREMTPTGVYVIDGVFELFVVVGTQARGKRTDIRLALYIAENISMAVARQRPFDPVIHVLVLPSLTPLDLKALFRDFDERALNDGHEPTHMNVITYEEAHDHMGRRSWSVSEVSDLDFLPLGVSPDMLS